MHLSRRLLVLPALVLTAFPCLAQRVRLAPVRTARFRPVMDNTLYEDPLGGLSNGIGSHLFAGLTATGAIRRAALAFDVSSKIPAGARIVSATLTLHVTRTIAGPQSMGLHLLLADWGEGTSNAFGEEGTGTTATTDDATWLHTFHPGSYWSAPGGDFASTASASRIVGFSGPHAWTSAGMVADVQAWVDDPATNHGWLLVGAEPPAGIKTAKRFGSREGPVVLRPMLIVMYDSLPKGACCLPDGACVRFDAEECLALGGVYQGDGSACAPDPCAPPAPF